MIDQNGQFMSRRLAALAGWLLAGALLAGCERMYGITRTARVPFLPDPAQVGAVLRATPGVTRVDFHRATGSAFGWTGPRPLQIYEFSHAAAGTGNFMTLEFTENDRHQVAYSQSLDDLGAPPPQAWIAAGRPLMLAIEQRLADTCGLTNLPATVVEHRHGVK